MCTCILKNANITQQASSSLPGSGKDIIEAYIKPTMGYYAAYDIQDKNTKNIIYAIICLEM